MPGARLRCLTSSPVLPSNWSRSTAIATGPFGTPHLGRDLWLEPVRGRRFAHLAEVGFHQQPTAHPAGWRKRNRERQGGVRLLHQPDTDQHPHAARRHERIGIGCRHERWRQLLGHPAGISAVAFVLRVRRRPTCRSPSRGWNAGRPVEPDRARLSVHSREALGRQC